jgi:hypothetical protein
VDADAPWRPWRPAHVAHRLSGIAVRWYVVAGWAIDLFLGEETREHEDLEIGVPRSDFPAVQACLSDCRFYVVGDGFRYPVTDEAAMATHFQTWAWDDTAHAYVLDVFRDPHDRDEWICRRDESIRRPYAEIVRVTDEGIPYLTPEVVLLFKAKHQREKDEADWARVRPLLDPQQRAWLVDALTRVHPGHSWIEELRDADP